MHWYSKNTTSVWFNLIFSTGYWLGVFIVTELKSWKRRLWGQLPPVNIKLFPNLCLKRSNKLLKVFVQIVKQMSIIEILPIRLAPLCQSISTSKDVFAAINIFYHQLYFVPPTNILFPRVMIFCRRVITFLKTTPYWNNHMSIQCISALSWCLCPKYKQKLQHTYSTTHSSWQSMGCFSVQSLCCSLAVREITKSSSTFSATNISNKMIWFLQLHDTIKMKSNHTGINYNHNNIATRSNIMIYDGVQNLVFATKFSNIYLA